MKCPNCGELKPTEVITTIPTKRPTQEAANFCGKCGARLEEEAQFMPTQDVIRGRLDTAKPIEVLF